MWQSLRIIEQAYQKVQEFKGAEAEVFHADAPAYYLPEKKDVYTKMEALIWHFKIVMGETEIPPGEVYHSVEGGNGEVGILPDQRWRTDAVPAAFPQALFYLLSGVFGTDEGGDAE